MKKMKKLLSMLLAVVMVLTMAAPSFAAEGDGASEKPGTITLDNPIDGVKYTAYKIFGVTYTEDKTTYAYSISGNSEWFNTVQAYATQHPTEIKLTQIDPETANKDYKVEVLLDDEKKALLDAAAFAQALKDANITTGGSDLVVGADGKASVKVDLGYYFVRSNNNEVTNAVCNLTTTDPNAIIHDKNKIIFDKTDDKVGVDLGEDVTYTITSAVPDTTGFDTYDYIITDKMSTGLTFNYSTLEIKIGDGNDAITITPNTNDKQGIDIQQSVKVDAKGNIVNNGGEDVDFRISIPVKNYAFNTPIVVTYKATVNSSAISKIEKNKAELHYSNDPTNHESRDKFTDEEDVYSVAIIIDKYVTGDNTKKLKGAEFILKRTWGEGDNAIVTYYTEEKQADGSTKVKWVSEQSEAMKKTTGDDGKTQFEGIKREDITSDGKKVNIKYELIETKAPDGYNLLDAPVEVDMSIKKKTFDQEGNETEVEIDPLEKDENGTYPNGVVISQLATTLQFAQGIGNSSGTILPSTGGIGTTIFYAAGIILMAGAVFFVVRRKRA